MKIKTIIQLLLIPLPWVLRRFVLIRLCNWEISGSARIGFSFISAAKVSLKDGSRVGHLNFISGLDELALGQNSTIGNLNWVTGGLKTTSVRKSRKGKPTRALYLRDESAITNRHYIDCTDILAIGSFSTFAGVRSQVLTHAIDLVRCELSTAPVIIGDYTFIGSGCIILPGASLPSFSILGAGSVLRKSHDESWTLYAGNPARPIRLIDRGDKYFSRNRGAIG